MTLRSTTRSPAHRPDAIRFRIGARNRVASNGHSLIEYGNPIVCPFGSGKIKPGNAIVGDRTTSFRFGENTMGIVPNVNCALATILRTSIS